MSGDPGTGIGSFDPFDLPDWTGTKQITWRAETTLDGGPHVRGLLAADASTQQLDLIAVDAAYPRLTCPADLRRQVHQAWQLGEVMLLAVDGRVAVAAPGVGFDANAACETLRRFTRSVGAPQDNLTVSIVL